MTIQLTTKTFQQRKSAMMAWMKAHGADAIVFTTADFVQYASNFAVDVFTWERLSSAS